MSRKENQNSRTWLICQHFLQNSQVMGDNIPNTPETSVILPQNISHDLCNVKANTLIRIVYLVEIIFSSLFTLDWLYFVCCHGNASTITIVSYMQVITNIICIKWDLHFRNCILVVFKSNTNKGWYFDSSPCRGVFNATAIIRFVVDRGEYVFMELRNHPHEITDVNTHKLILPFALMIG